MRVPSQRDRAARRDAAAAKAGTDSRVLLTRAFTQDTAKPTPSGPSFGISGDGSDDEGVTASPTTRAPAIDIVDSDNELDVKLGQSTVVYPAGTSDGGVTSPDAPKFNTEITELDALERELGLDLGMSEALKAPFTSPVAERPVAVTVSPEVAVVPPTTTVTDATPATDAGVPPETVLPPAPAPVVVEAPKPAKPAPADDDIEALESFLDNL